MRPVTALSQARYSHYEGHGFRRTIWPFSLTRLIKVCCRSILLCSPSPAHDGQQASLSGVNDCVVRAGGLAAAISIFGRLTGGRIKKCFHRKCLILQCLQSFGGHTVT